MSWKLLHGKDSPTEAEIEAYRKDHPLTRVVLLTWKDCGKDCME